MQLKQHTSPELSGKEKKYGRNWLNHLVMCPRCCEGVPVKFLKTEQGYEMHCRKCETLGHIEGSLIKIFNLLAGEPDVRKIMDG
jgi:hypothetical protein